MEVIEIVQAHLLHTLYLLLLERGIELNSKGARPALDVAEREPCKTF
jgi:hypothetical protein